MQKYKHEIILVALITVLSVVLYFLYGLILPFLFGIALVFYVNPVVSKIQKVVRSRNLANVIFLVLGVATIGFVLFFFTSHINRDFKRLNNSFTVLVSQNKSALDKSGQIAKSYIDKVYNLDQWEEKLKVQTDSLNTKLKSGITELDTEAIKSAFQELGAFFENDNTKEAKEKPSFGFLFIFFSTLLYFVLILFEFPYFENLKKKYFSSKMDSMVSIISDDFKQSFLRYFKLRTRIVLILTAIYLSTFIILDIPGIILLTFVVFILSYIPYMQYFALLPLSVGCLVLSIEGNHSFLLFFGIIIGIFILASVLEELVLTPWIMEKNIGINPVIMVLALSIWSYLLGLPGLLIGIPLTSLTIIYFKRFILPSYNKTLLKQKD